MTTQTQSRTQTVPRRGEARPWLARLTLILISILILSNLVAALLVAGFQIYHDGLIFPGVSVWGVDLSGMTPAEAVTALSGRFNYPQTVMITFRDEENIWPVAAADLGVRFDVARTVQAAYEVGRQPQIISSLQQQVAAWRDGIVISPVIIYDQRSAEAVLNQIAAVINRPALDAYVTINGLEATATPGQIGRMVDMAATLETLGQQITTLESGEVLVAVIESEPQIMAADATAQTINTILSADLEVYIEKPYDGDPGPWIASREALARMLVIDRVDMGGGKADYAVRLDNAQLDALLQPLVPELAREARDARFDFDPATGQLTPLVNSQEQRALNIPASVQQINQLVVSGSHRVPLVFDTTPPAVPDTATAEELGIKELIASASTYFAGSSQERRANIQTAASRFNGLVIPPGAEFSFNEHLGDVSVETGFEQALIIYNGRTITGVGGGVCQVSTTAFQAAFYAGLPVNERWPHGYWVSYYDSGEGKGMDATVYSPLVDLRFTNDLSTYMLIETETDLNNLTVTFRFYSTSDGRTVQKDGPYVTNVVPHGPDLYEENPDLAPGTVKKVDYAVDGFDAAVYRTVYRNGQVLYQDTFFSQYMPWQAIYQVPPGEIPPGAARVNP
jgi:vancomycin resistance protein YoaR